MGYTKEQATEYFKSVLSRFKEDPSLLSKDERRLAKKYVESSEMLRKTLDDYVLMQNQIKQSQDRLRNLELRSESLQGKCDGFVEYLVDLKFEEEDAPDQDPDEEVQSIPIKEKSGTSKELNEDLRASA